VLGPTAISDQSIGSAQVQSEDGQWVVNIDFTASGSKLWGSLARSQFHALIAVVGDGRVISVPITQPTSVVFTSFNGRMQIAAEFTQKQAEALAARL
jgi:preprotein translocase subunit SecD